MKSLNQNQINKGLIIILFILISLMTYSKITEQKRVDNYICFYELIGTHRDDPDAVKSVMDHCKERND